MNNRHLVTNGLLSQERSRDQQSSSYGHFTKTDLVIVEGLVNDPLSGLCWSVQDISDYPDIENILRILLATYLIVLIKCLAQVPYFVSQL